VKNADKSAKPSNGKQKKQLIMLGGLSAVFAAVLAIQFSGTEAEPAVAAMTAPAPAPATGTPDVAAAAEAPSGTPIPVAKDNTVLAEPLADATIKRSPFSNFWNNAPKATTSSVVPTLNAPTITLNATMPSDVAGIAVIDGQLHFVGDSIQGWSLAEVSPRSVTLRAPAGETVVVDMPLLVGKRALPAAAAADGEAHGGELPAGMDEPSFQAADDALPSDG
jgi:hypothetical protein